MTTTTEMPARATNANGLIGDAGPAIGRIANRIFSSIATLGESTQLAHKAQRFAELNRMTDSQLKKQGYRREDLAYRVFGAGSML